MQLRAADVRVQHPARRAVHRQYAEDVRRRRHVRWGSLQLHANRHGLHLRVQRRFVDLQPRPLRERDVQLAPCHGLLRHDDATGLLDPGHLLGWPVQLFVAELRLQHPATGVLHGQHRSHVRRRLVQRRRLQLQPHRHLVRQWLLRWVVCCLRRRQQLRHEPRSPVQNWCHELSVWSKRGGGVQRQHQRGRRLALPRRSVRGRSLLQRLHPGRRLLPRDHSHPMWPRRGRVLQLPAGPDVQLWRLYRRRLRLRVMQPVVPERGVRRRPLPLTNAAVTTAGRTSGSPAPRRRRRCPRCCAPCRRRGRRGTTPGPRWCERRARRAARPGPPRSARR